MLTDNDKITIIVTMHNQAELNKRCIETIIKYLGGENLELVVIDYDSCKEQSLWVRNQDYLTYVYFAKDEAGYAEMVNRTIKELDIQNDFIIIDSLLWTKMDFISNIRSILADNSDIGTVSPIFSCDTYVSLFGTVAIDENLYKNGQFHSNIYDAIWTQHCAIYIKYELWNKIGGFCEKFIAPYYVIMDYQLRVLKNGYRNVIALECFLRTDSKINVFCGPIHDVEMTNEIWGLHYLNSWENKSLNNIIREINRENIHNILEVGCASGANLMGLKNSYPDAALYGIELNPHAADIANCFANVVQGNIETDEIPFKDVKFDVIMFGDVLEHLRNPEETVRMCKNYLSENGRIVCSIPNVQHISVLRPLIYGRFEYTEVGLLDKTHIHLFTGQEIVKMFANAGYTIEKMICRAVNLSKEDEEAIVKLRKVFPDTNEIEFKTFQYLVCAKN